MQAYRVTFRWALLELSFAKAQAITPRGHLSLSRSIARNEDYFFFFRRVKFMLHDFYVGTFFDYFFPSRLIVFILLSSLALGFCIVISHVEFFLLFQHGEDSLFLFHLVL